MEIIINADSGASDKEEARRVLAEVFCANNIDARIHLARNGAEIIDLARRAVSGDCQTIVAGGGDGTISTVASKLVGTEKTLGVLPLGTLNHFAKDLHIPLDLEEAARTIITGHVARVDVGEVNGHIFINNSSLGLYPEVVRGREQEQRLGYGKWNAFVRSAFRVFRRYPFLDVRLNADDKEIAARTPFVFIGNNEYEMERFNIGARACLDAGHLSLYMTRRTGRLALLHIAWRAFFGNLKQAKDFLSLCTNEIFIETRRKHLRVAMDGEVLMLRTPLLYNVRRSALRVIVPAKAEHGCE